MALKNEGVFAGEISRRSQTFAVGNTDHTNHTNKQLGKYLIRNQVA